MSHEEFHNRLIGLQQKHGNLDIQGDYVARAQQNGTVVATPAASRKARRMRPSMMLLVLAACFFGFKGLMLSYLGSDEYAKRLAMLNLGNDWEKAAAWALQADPVTEFLSYDLRPRVMTIVEAIATRVEEGDLALASNLPPQPDEESATGDAVVEQ